MKKKVGLLTMPLLDNYGGIIQIAALYNFLQSVGYTPYLIDRKYDLPYIKVLVKKFLEYNPFYRIIDPRDYTKRRLHLRNINRFVDDFFKNKTKPIYNQVNLKLSVKEYNAIIVGSDQVWRFNYVKNNYKNYFLDFIKAPIDKISYAASFGTDEWEGPQDSIKIVSKLLNEFKGVSVREDSGVTLCKDTFGVNAEHVLDPTFLPNLDFYNNLISEGNHSNEVELFSYVLDNSKSKQRFILEVSEILDLKIKTIYLANNFKDRFLKPGISEWLYHFKRSQFVVTDSFHGMVFSIIFNKQFIALGNESRGLTRFTSLLRLLNLEHRLVIGESDMGTIVELLKKKIDYNSVNQKLDLLRKVSKTFLIKNLE